jgi:hypothetical protein
MSVTYPAAKPTTVAEPRLRPLETLTDEEISVLGPDQGVVVAPFLSEMADAERDTARATAFRGLVARGIVDPGDADDTTAPVAEPVAEPAASGDVAVDVRVRGDVLSLLTLRQGAPAVVAVARTSTVGQDFWYAHVVEEVLLLEEVSATGLHRFALGHARDLPTLLARAALHPDATDGSGEPIELPVAPDGDAPAELVERIGLAYLRCDVLVVTRTVGQEVERPEMTGLFTGPLGSWSIVARPGSPRAWAQAETRDSLGRRLDDLAAQALAAGAVA